jgi:hypothetical protein
MAFKKAFPVLFGVACANDDFVAAQVEFSRGAIQWNTGFAKVDHDYELMPLPRSLGCCM